MIEIKIKRVCYGKKDTPEELKEYTIVGSGSSAVGTKSEIESYFLIQKGISVNLVEVLA